MALFFGNKNTQTTANPAVSAGEAEILRDAIDLTKNSLKPHFINTMLTSIYYLCETDPQQAQSVSMTLSGYILNIMESFGSEEPVPFSKELDLVKHYISLEHLRLEDRLKTDYDIYISDFKVPPLTIAPLVENAVKHGIAPKSGTGTVTISTRRIADDGVQLKIIDDGVGFDMKTTDISHGDTQKCKDRLARRLGADMSIESEPGKGTVITITIQKQE